MWDQLALEVLLLLHMGYVCLDLCDGLWQVLGACCSP